MTFTQISRRCQDDEKGFEGLGGSIYQGVRWPQAPGMKVYLQYSRHGNGVLMLLSHNYCICYIIIVYGYVRLHGMLKSAYRILEVFWSGDVFCLIGGVLVMRHFGRNPLVMAWLFRYINKIVFPDQNLLIFLK